ncbi:MAG TPA: SDR family NAD(P)-dependent oxidoreductase [Nocardioidaceae bacterium]|nr:SDR family NAD(P)-dependent oxidoreductase [Nocardioidaceae bacterium]
MNRRSLTRTAASLANRVTVTPVDRTLLRPKSLRGAVEGKVVLVTGASSGIGRATALKVGQAGGVVLLVARTADALENLRNEIKASGGTAYAYPCDLSDLDQVDALVEQVLDAHGAVDILVNNAGLSIRRKARNSFDRFHDFQRPMQLNYFAAVKLASGLLPAMTDRRTGQIVNISSWAVQVRPSRFSGYTASKAALEAWSDCVQGEVLDDGVVFTNIRMPLVRTPMIQPTKIYRRIPALSPEQAAQVVCDAMVTRSRRVSPLAARMLSVAEVISPRAADRIRQNAV